MKNPQVTLHPVTRDQQAPLVNLLELYIHDMSELVPIQISPEGRFGYAWLPTYWAEPDRRFAYLIHGEEGLAGFVLVTTGPQNAPEEAEGPHFLEVAEFFIIRRWRRSGVGRAAVHKLWDAHPGRWVVHVSEANLGALAFWSKAVAAYAGAQFQEKVTPGRHAPWRVFELESRTVK